MVLGGHVCLVQYVLLTLTAIAFVSKISRFYSVIMLISIDSASIKRRLIYEDVRPTYAPV